jgi:hypothetical protein
MTASRQTRRPLLQGISAASPEKSRHHEPEESLVCLKLAVEELLSSGLPIAREGQHIIGLKARVGVLRPVETSMMHPQSNR